MATKQVFVANQILTAATSTNGLALVTALSAMVASFVAIKVAW